MGSEWAFRSLLVKAANTSGRQGMAGQTEESVIGHWRKEDSCCKVLESLAKLLLVVTQKIEKKSHICVRSLGHMGYAYSNVLSLVNKS